MNCEEAAISISALFDGEPVSREAAAHVSECEQCRSRLSEYAQIGAELRRMAGASAPRVPADGAWKTAGRVDGIFSNWRRSRRIPRLAFAVMVLAIVLLSGGLALVRARAAADGPALSLTVKLPTGDKVMHCAIRTRETEGQPSMCGFINYTDGGTLRVSVRFVRRIEDRVQLAIKTNFASNALAGSFDGKVDAPDEEYWLEPDRTLGVSVAGLGTVQISGEFLDHLPAFELLPQEALEPGPNEFRIFSPILIKDNRVIANMTGALGREEGTDPAVILYVPQEGRFVFAPIAFDGAVPAKLQQNQISFTVDGKVYLLTTAAPISRSEHVWVLHQPDWRPTRQESQPAGDSWSLASGKLHALLSQ